MSDPLLVYDRSAEVDELDVATSRYFLETSLETVSEHLLLATPLGDDLVPLAGMIREPGIGSLERFSEERTFISDQRLVHDGLRLHAGGFGQGCGPSQCLLTHPNRRAHAQPAAWCTVQSGPGKTTAS